MWKFVARVFEIGMFDVRAAEALMVLIPKEHAPLNFKNFLPISLLNVLYMLISKVLVNRLRLVLINSVLALLPSYGMQVSW